MVFHLTLATPFLTEMRLKTVKQWKRGWAVLCAREFLTLCAANVWVCKMRSDEAASHIRFWQLRREEKMIATPPTKKKTEKEKGEATRQIQYRRVQCAPDTHIRVAQIIISFYTWQLRAFFSTSSHSGCFRFGIFAGANGISLNERVQ